MFGRLSCCKCCWRQSAYFCERGISKTKMFLKHLHSLPCQYCSQKKSWMDGSFFTEWGMKSLRNGSCPAQPNVDKLQAVELIFLPPNTTSKTLHMDRGIMALTACCDPSTINTLCFSVSKYATTGACVSFSFNWMNALCSTMVHLKVLLLLSILKAVVPGWHNFEYNRYKCLPFQENWALPMPSGAAHCLMDV